MLMGMSRFPDRKTVERRRQEWPKGTKVRLDFMDDPQAPPKGMEGVVDGVDDAGQIMVRWSTGSGLRVIPEAGDKITKIGGGADV